MQQRAAFAAFVLMLAPLVGCSLTIGGSAEPASPRAERGVARNCLVDGVASSPGTERCFFDQIKVCDASGVWTSKVIYSAELCRAQQPLRRSE